MLENEVNAGSTNSSPRLLDAVPARSSRDGWLGKYRRSLSRSFTASAISHWLYDTFASLSVKWVLAIANSDRGAPADQTVVS
jgi:hypothetical protein